VYSESVLWQRAREVPEIWGIVIQVVRRLYFIFIVHIIIFESVFISLVLSLPTVGQVLVFRRLPRRFRLRKQQVPLTPDGLPAPFQE